MDLIFVANMWYYCRCKNHNLNRTILQFHHSKQVVADLLYDAWKPWLSQIPIIFTLNTLGAMASPNYFRFKKEKTHTHTHTLLILHKYQLLLAAQRLVSCCAPTICYVCRILRSLLGFCYPSPNLRHDLDLQILYCLVLLPLLLVILGVIITTWYCKVVILVHRNPQSDSIHPNYV